nr:PREDICTED: phosphatidylinositol transfer protein 2-like [Struthio camelus australis]
MRQRGPVRNMSLGKSKGSSCFRTVAVLAEAKVSLVGQEEAEKKSREESSGEGSGVEILANRPYSDGPGGSGQYTHKIYHVGSHIPSWFRALLPKAALQVEEESWNAYPYTRTSGVQPGRVHIPCLAVQFVLCGLVRVSTLTSNKR